MSRPGGPRRANPLAGGAMGGGRAFVDHTGTPVPLRGSIRRIVATDEGVAALVRETGAELVGCAGAVDGVETVGATRSPDHAAVAALKPDVIVTGAADGVHDLTDRAVLGKLQQIAPVIAVDLSRRAAAAADLRALFGSVKPPPRHQPS